MRRNLLNVQKPISAFFMDDAYTHSNKEPFFCKGSDLLFDIVSIMGEKKIWDYPVLDSDHKLIGLLHLHPAIKTILSKV